MKNDTENQAEKLNRHALTEAEQRQLGDAEVAMWTITKPGGKPMTLAEHEKQRLEDEEKQRIFNEGAIADQKEREQAYKDFHGEDLPEGASDDDDC